MLLKKQVKPIAVLCAPIKHCLQTAQQHQNHHCLRLAGVVDLKNNPIVESIAITLLSEAQEALVACLVSVQAEPQHTPEINKHTLKLHSHVQKCSPRTATLWSSTSSRAASAHELLLNLTECYVLLPPGKTSPGTAMCTAHFACGFRESWERWWKVAEMLWTRQDACARSVLPALPKQCLRCLQMRLSCNAVPPLLSSSGGTQPEEPTARKQPPLLPPKTHHCSPYTVRPKKPGANGICPSLASAMNAICFPTLSLTTALRR